MKAYDDLLNDEDALERLRAKRLDKLKAEQKKRLDWQAQGHGRYMELSDTKVRARARARSVATKQW